MTNIAFSYIRMSSERQLKGSLKRQLERSQKYADKHGLQLDTSLRDLGVSAFSGANRERGALGRFLQMVREGRIPKGASLLVESLDRLSRDHVFTAFTVFSEIVVAGIKVVTLADEMEYSQESVKGNWTQLIISIAIMSRAHEESAIKADRLRKTWVKKREGVATEKLTARAPSWLKMSDDRTRFDVLPDRAAVIVRIFEELANGIGRGGIARRLNADGVPPMATGRLWSSGIISKVTSARAVLGEYQPGRMHQEVIEGVTVARRVTEGEPVSDYYPQIVSDELWARAQASSKARALPKPSNSAGRKGSRVSNLFSGFARCETCGGTMIYRDRGPRSTVVLCCSSSAQGGTCGNAVTVPYARLEAAILDFVSEVDFSLPETEGDASRMRGNLATLEDQMAALKQKIEFLLNLAEDGEEVRERLAGRREERKTLEEKITKQRLEIERSQVAITPTERKAIIADLRTKMETGDIYLIRSRMAQMLREMIERIQIAPSGQVYVVILEGLVSYTMSPDFKTVKKRDRRSYITSGELPARFLTNLTPGDAAKLKRLMAAPPADRRDTVIVASNNEPK